jgi:hypothetical protein
MKPAVSGISPVASYSSRIEDGTNPPSSLEALAGGVLPPPHPVAHDATTPSTARRGSEKDREQDESLMPRTLAAFVPRPSHDPGTGS